MYGTKSGTVETPTPFCTSKKSSDGNHLCSIQGWSPWHTQADLPLLLCPTGCSNRKYSPSPHRALPTVQHCAPQLSWLSISVRQALTSSPGHPPQRHPPGCDEIQQPVYPDLLDATVRHSTDVGKVQLLVPTKVEPVSLVMRQWGAGDRTKK